MRKNSGLRALPLVACAFTGLVLAGCSRTELVSPAAENENTLLAARTAPQGTTIYYGPVTQLGNGHIRSFGLLEKQSDKPLQIGFQLNAGALQGLPDGHDGSHHSAYVVKLHPKVQSAGVFDHLVADWNPHGHMPGPYLPAHFDFHFYMLSMAQRMQITATDPLSVSPLPAGYLPNDYIGPLGPEPEMGGHCVDITSPELGGAAFTHTFIYGAYDSKVAFYEPMITHDYLVNGSGGNFAIKQPAYFSKSGYYPTRYSISTDAGGTRYVVLSDFVYRTAN